MASQSRRYRGWSPIEEAKLVELLVIMRTSGQHKADNGFKSGYLKDLEAELKKSFPDSGLLAKPHIESKVKILRRDWQVVHDMFHGSSTSGFGWKDGTKLLDAPNDVWETYILHHKEAAKWRNKPFPHYEDLCIAFGPDRAQGNGARDFGQMEEDVNTEEVHELDDDFDVVMESTPNATRSSNVDEATPGGSSRNKRKSRVDPMQEGLREAYTLFGDALDKAASKMSRDIELEEALEKKADMVCSELVKMISLSQIERFRAIDIITSNPRHVKTFWGLEEEEREAWVRFKLQE